MAKRVCKRCKIFVKGSECPICHGSNLTESWHGRINITDADKSEVAKRLSIKQKGEYVIKVR